MAKAIAMSNAERIFSRMLEMDIIKDKEANTKPQNRNEVADIKQVKPAIPMVPIKESLQDFEVQRQFSEEQGQKNQAYYLNQAKKTGKLWFRCPRQQWQYSEFITITPEMAKQLLAHNPGNRPVSEQLVNSYGRDMNNDFWCPTSESVDIDIQQNMSDGQHRLHAVINNNKPCTLYVTFNVPVASRFVIDSGKRRTVNEKLNMVISNNYGARFAALCRGMMRGMNYQKIIYSESEIADFAIKHADVLDFLMKKLPTVRGVKAGVQAAAGKAILWYGMDAVAPFCHKLNNVAFGDNPNDPVKLLSNFLIQKKGTRNTGISIYAKTLSAIEAEMKGASIRALYEKRADLFEWESGWDVPAGSPADRHAR